MKKIEVIIKPDGSTSVEAFGYQGGECIEATKPFEKALGVSENRKKKPEYYTSVSLSNQNKVGRDFNANS